MFAQAAVMRMAGLVPCYPGEPVGICFARQFQKDIDDSVKQVIEGCIVVLGLEARVRRP